jgi:hypothetical protein
MTALAELSYTLDIAPVEVYMAAMEASKAVSDEPDAGNRLAQATLGALEAGTTPPNSCWPIKPTARTVSQQLLTCIGENDRDIQRNKSAIRTCEERMKDLTAASADLSVVRDLRREVKTKMSSTSSVTLKMYHQADENRQRIAEVLSVPVAGMAGFREFLLLEAHSLRPADISTLIASLFYDTKRGISIPGAAWCAKAEDHSKAPGVVRPFGLVISRGKDVIATSHNLLDA